MSDMFTMRKFIAMRKSINDNELDGSLLSDENIFRAHHHIDIGFFKCEFCPEEFDNKSSLKNHRVLVHPNKNKRKECEFCSKKFRSKIQLKIHQKSHSEDKMYRCTFCNAKFESANLLSDHKRTHVGEQPYQCDICGSKFTYKSHLNKHKLVLHGKRKLFFCKLCQTTHGTSIRPIGEEPSECGICSEKFETKSGLVDHIIEMVSGDKTYECDICGTKVGPNNALYAHEVTHRRNFKCIICQKEFVKRFKLIKHQYIHVLGEKRLGSRKSVTAENHSTETRIETCREDLEDEVKVKELQDLVSSSMETNLENVIVKNECEIKIEKSELHNMIESEQVPESISPMDATFENDILLFKCEICREEFVNNARLRTHKSLKHKVNKLHECEFCSQKFRLKTYLEIHLTKSHSEDKMYRCFFCNAEFESAGLRSEHKTIHTGETPYQCNICGNKFKGKSYIRKHKRIMHGKKKLFFCESCQTTHSSSTRPIGEQLECGICSEKFESKSGLVDHIIEMVSGDKTYECDICGTKVGPNNTLYAHEVTYRRNLKCIICRKYFVRRSQLIKHQQLHVGNENRSSSGKSVTAVKHSNRQSSETRTETDYLEDEFKVEELRDFNSSPIETNLGNVFVKNEDEIEIEISELHNMVKSEEVPDTISSVGATFENVYVKSEYEIKIEPNELQDNE